MIEAENLTKVFGRTTAVSDLSFTVQPGRVTGFLGRNGAGKSTTLRLLLGLDHPTSGRGLINGKRYREFSNPLSAVGALLDSSWVHPHRSARRHLQWLARSNKIPHDRVSTVLQDVELADVADDRVGTFSLGMKQRLGIAAAMLGDPEVLMFDEPLNGLDPEGIAWMRERLVQFARDGRTVLVSSHMLSEVSLIAQDLVIIDRGRLVTRSTVDDFLELAGSGTIRVRSPQLHQLREALRLKGIESSCDRDALYVSGSTVAEVGNLAAGQGIVVHELARSATSLEEAFLKLTQTAAAESTQLNDQRE